MRQESRMPSNLGIKRAPFLVLGNFIRKLGLQKGNNVLLGILGVVGSNIFALTGNCTCKNISETFRQLYYRGTGAFQLKWLFGKPARGRVQLTLAKETREKAGEVVHDHAFVPVPNCFGLKLNYGLL